jgi:hypothetical protein
MTPIAPIAPMTPTPVSTPGPRRRSGRPLRAAAAALGVGLSAVAWLGVGGWLRASPPEASPSPRPAPVVPVPRPAAEKPDPKAARPAGPASAATPAVPGDKLTDDERKRLAEWVERLGDADFPTRENAQERLTESAAPLGGRAVPYLMAAARTGDAETALRIASVMRALMSSTPLPELAAGLDAKRTAGLLAIALDGRTDRASAEWFAGDDEKFPAAMRLAAAGILTGFMEGSPELAANHCDETRFVRHGSRGVTRAELLSVWRTLSPNWTTFFGRLTGLEAMTGREATERSVDTSFPDQRDDDRIVKFRFTQGSENSDDRPLVFVFRRQSGGGQWRAVALFQPPG